MGPIKADLLKKELGIHTYGDYLLHFPFRYEDRSTMHLIKDVTDNGVSVQLKGTIYDTQIVKGQRGSKRLVCILKDPSGFLELTWFKGVKVMDNIIRMNEEYLVHGKVKVYKGKKSIIHPEVESVAEAQTKIKGSFAPVYSSTEKLNNKGLDNRARRNIASEILSKITAQDIPEILPQHLIDKFRLVSRYQAVKNVHIPANAQIMEAARNRIKFEELFFFQIQAIQSKVWRQQSFKGYVFEHVGNYFNTFYKEQLPFDLTGAQKRVVREIRSDVKSGKQMNRLLQGDVGSGKTIVALLTCLIAKDNGFQSCLMAPTEILAQQHFTGISEYVEGMDIEVGFLSGSVKGKKRAALLERLKNGDIDILIGTHALIDDWVVFSKLGLAITDEQHRFGVKHRAKLWEKSTKIDLLIQIMFI